MLKAQLTDLGLKGYLLVTRMKKIKRGTQRNGALDKKVEYTFCEQLT